MSLSVLLMLGIGFVSGPAPTEEIWHLTDAISIGGITRGGRVPFPQDELVGEMVNRPSALPAKAGDTLRGRGGTERKWVAVKANAKGELNQPQGGYVQALVESDRDRDAILTVNGDGGAYWNGDLHPGDVYGYGYLSLPVHVNKGENVLLVAGGRSNLTARLDGPRAPQQFNLADPTLPDVLTTDRGTLVGGVVVLNSANVPARGLRIKATIDGKSVESVVPEIGPYTFRKAPFDIPVMPGAAGKPQTMTLELEGVGGPEDSGELNLSVVDPLTTHKRTFISHIDGSVQYYGVVPAKKPSKENALILTLHGASVEAIGQARAYQAKDWCTIVAATNRRPYGFDWEDMGRLDALEVLNIAKRTYLHDPARVELTGHSMGGHGTWSIGTLYPDLFAAIAPSAGWVSFQSYAGGFNPTKPDAKTQIFLDAAAPSDTLARVRNTLEERTYILHGDMDDNVPVTEARTMKKALTDIGANFTYHEQPGAGHWWGNQCVDWPPLFDVLQAARLKRADDPAPIDFTTPDPQVSSTLRWATIERERRAGESWVRARVDGGALTATTSNVGALELRKPNTDVHSVTVDGQAIRRASFPLRLENRGGTWQSVGRWETGWKSPVRTGGFKEAFDNRMVFVVGTAGDDAAKLSSFARYLSESLYYRGNGAVDIWSDAYYLKHRQDRAVRDRNVILFGNADDNAAWPVLLANCPIKVDRNSVKADFHTWNGPDMGALITYPLAGSNTALVAAFGVTGPGGIDELERLPVLASGSGYPDWSILNASQAATTGIGGVVAAGNFAADWTMPSSVEKGN